MTRISRRASVIITAATLVAAGAPALASGPTPSGSPSATEVSVTASGPGSRQLQVLDLAGNNLTSLALQPGVPQPFRVKVSDTGVGQLTVLATNGSPAAGFTVDATMNNLYAGGSATATAMIESKDVSIGFPGTGGLQAGATVTALPRILLNGTLGSCTAVFSTLATLLSGLSPTSGAGLTLCAALGGATATTGPTITDLTVAADAAETIDGLTQVPFTLGGQDPGAFTLPDYANGIGNADTRGLGVAGTVRTLLTGTPAISSALTAELNSALSALSSQTAISETGANAKTSVTNVLGAMAAIPALNSLYTALMGLSPAQAAGILNQYLTGVVQPIGLSDILSVTGAYQSFPTITASPSTPVPAAGTYKGTMTVTLVQP